MSVRRPFTTLLYSKPPLPPTPTAGMGVSAWTPLAHGAGRCPPPCGPDAEQRNSDNPGAQVAQPPGERKGV